MENFKVGDRVRVKSEPESYTGRPYPSIGINGTVESTSRNGPQVLLDTYTDSNKSWAYKWDEIELIHSPVVCDIRDQFAMAALTGVQSLHLLAVKSGGSGYGSSNEMARQSYELADAMMAERERGK